MKIKKNYYIYLLRCKDNSIYTGITVDITKRYSEHLAGKGAKYTKIKGVEKLETFFMCEGRSEASKVEYYLKKLSKVEKERAILDFQWLKDRVGEKIKIKIKK